MIAPLAQEDYEDLVAEGLNPTLRDFDKLNTLALRFQCGKETTAANAPRTGWAGDVPFHQPTFQALAWFKEFAERVSDDPETQGTLFAYACHMGRTPGAFDKLRTPDEIVAAVKPWADSLPTTREEVERAIHYVVFGYESGETSAKSPRLNVAERSQLDKLAEKMNRACAVLGLSPSVLWLETPSRLDDLVVAWHIEQEHELKMDTAKLDCEYKEALHEIRERLTAEKTQKEAE